MASLTPWAQLISKQPGTPAAIQWAHCYAGGVRKLFGVFLQWYKLNSWFTAAGNANEVCSIQAGSSFHNLQKLIIFNIQKESLETSKTSSTLGEMLPWISWNVLWKQASVCLYKDYPVVWSQTRSLVRSTYFSILLCLLAQLPLNQESQHVADKNSDVGKKQTRLGLGLEFTLEVPASTSSSNPTTHYTRLA